MKTQLVGVDDQEHIPDDLTLWRYLDFPKFLDLLVSEAIKIPLASAMEDKYEGQMGKGAYLSAREHYAEQAAKKYLADPYANYDSKISNFWSRRTYVSCWNQFPSENAGLWRIYGDDKGVAIKTSWGSLKRSLAGESDEVSTIFYGCVKYLNFEARSDYIDNYTDKFFQKRREFSHEKEFRLVAHNSSVEHNYTNDISDVVPKLAVLKCDTSVLIEELLISPRLSPWVSKVVEEVTAKYSGDWPVRRSKIYDTPETR